MEPLERQNVAQRLTSRLEAHGVATVFGLPGEENLAVVEALGRSDIEFVATRHEQHAAFMAATHGRLTGEPGVCLATLGPGATNLVTGLAHAQLGGMPVVAITGQKPLRDNDEGSFQVLDVTSVARPVTKTAVTLHDPANVDVVIDVAFAQAVAGRPGVALIEIPEDVAGAEVTTKRSPTPQPSIGPTAASLGLAAALLNSAEQPVVLASGGATQGSVADALTRFAEATGIGVLATQMGKGAIPESHPLSMRTLGMHRGDYAHLAIADADVVLTVGYSPVEHPPLAWNPREDITIVHLAPWPAPLERGYQATVQCVGDCASSLDNLVPLVQRRPPDEMATRRQAIVNLLEEEEATESSFPPAPLNIARELRSQLKPHDVVALDNGAYKLWFARHYSCEAPNTLLLDNALATMGAGLATAMEAKRVHPDRTVVGVCGDGGFLMNVQDVETACRLDLDLTVVVLRDDAYGFIGWHQEEQDRPRESVSLGNPDLVQLAAAFGANGHRVSHDRPFAEVLHRAISESGVSIIDCPIDYSTNEVLEGDLLPMARARLRVLENINNQNS